MLNFIYRKLYVFNANTSFEKAFLYIKGENECNM